MDLIIGWSTAIFREELVPLHRLDCTVQKHTNRLVDPIWVKLIEQLQAHPRLTYDIYLVPISKNSQVSCETVLSKH
jgi:hypothetical protein